jgi:excisionase family DNA binding protein
MTSEARDFFFSVAEVVDLTKLSPATVRRAIRLGHLRAVRPTGVRRLLISADALEAFLKPSRRTIRVRNEG